MNVSVDEGSGAASSGAGSGAAGGSASGVRVEVVSGGHPGDEVMAAVAAVVTRPVVLVPSADDDEAEPGQSPWVRAARLEGIVHGRRITTRADLTWRR